MADSVTNVRGRWQVFPHEVWRIIVSFLDGRDLVAAGGAFSALRECVISLIQSNIGKYLTQHQTCAKSGLMYTDDVDCVLSQLNYIDYGYNCVECGHRDTDIISYTELMRRYDVDETMKHCRKSMYVRVEPKHYPSLLCRWIFHGNTPEFYDEDSAGTTASMKVVTETVANGVNDMDAVKSAIDYNTLCNLVNGEFVEKFTEEHCIDPDDTYMTNRMAKALSELTNVLRRYDFIIKMHEYRDNVLARYACYLRWTKQQPWVIRFIIPEWAKREDPLMLRCYLTEAEERGVNPFPLGANTPKNPRARRDDETEDEWMDRVYPDGMRYGEFLDMSRESPFAHLYNSYTSKEEQPAPLDFPTVFGGGDDTPKQCSIM